MGYKLLVWYRLRVFNNKVVMKSDEGVVNGNNGYYYGLREYLFFWL